jgi:hypothetical protein
LSRPKTPAGQQQARRKRRQMAGWLFATLLWLGLILWLGIAAAADWQLRLTGAGNLYTQSAVWSGHFTAANGRFYDASHLYQNRRRPLYLSGEMQLFGLALPGRAARHAAEQAGGRAAAGGFWNGPFNLILPFAYDNGFDSAKFTTRPRLTLGAALQGRHRQLVWQMRLDGLIDRGGGISERACYDATGRDFHCGTGLPWANSGPAHITCTSRQAASLRLVWLW